MVDAPVRVSVNGDALTPELPAGSSPRPQPATAVRIAAAASPISSPCCPRPKRWRARIMTPIINLWAGMVAMEGVCRWETVGAPAPFARAAIGRSIPQFAAWKLLQSQGNPPYPASPSKGRGGFCNSFLLLFSPALFPGHFAPSRQQAAPTRDRRRTFKRWFPPAGPGERRRKYWWSAS